MMISSIRILLLTSPKNDFSKWLFFVILAQFPHVPLFGEDAVIAVPPPLYDLMAIFLLLIIDRDLLYQIHLPKYLIFAANIPTKWL